MLRLGSEVERLYFGNLSYDTTVETMRELFEQHGTVLNLFITEDFATRQSRGYGFAQVLKEDAKRMMEALNGIEIDGRSIRVTAAEDKVDRMRIYCGNFAFEATADSIRSLFEEFGQVFSIYFPEDRQFGGSRGFAILTMEKESGEKAIKALNGREVDGREIRVNEAKPKGGSAKKSLRLYIGNLDFDTTTETLREAFSEYGEVKDCFLPQDKEYGGSRGFGFVTMDADDAKVAIDELDGIELDGRVIRVVEATGSSKKQGGATEEDGEYDEE
jgi:RNA recognition motif-containing protein